MVKSRNWTERNHWGGNLPSMTELTLVTLHERSVKLQGIYSVLRAVFVITLTMIEQIHHPAHKLLP